MKEHDECKDKDAGLGDDGEFLKSEGAGETSESEEEELKGEGNVKITGKLRRYQDARKVHVFSAYEKVSEHIGLGIFLVGVGFLASYLISREIYPLGFSRGTYEFIAGAGFLAGGLSILMGIINLIGVAVKKKRSFSCPVCHKEDAVFEKARKFACVTCNSVLLLGNGENSPEESVCSYCGYKSYVAKDYGEYLCPDCGVKYRSDRSESAEGVKLCSFCKREIPESAFFCKSCLGILADRVPILDAEDLTIPVDKSVKESWDMMNYSYATEPQTELEDPYWIESKSLKGKLVYTMALLTTIRNDASFIITDSEKMGLLYAKFTDIIEDVRRLLNKSKGVVELQVVDFLKRTVTCVDLTYADLIQVQLREAEKLFGSGRRVYDTEAKGVLFSSHITARKFLASSLKDLPIKQDTSPEWNMKLIQTKSDVDVLAGSLNSNKEWFIKEADLSKLREESRQLREWALSRNR